MSRVLILAAIAALTLPAAGVATAQVPHGPKAIARLDSNGDGKITVDEFVAYSGHRFEQFDTDRDGKLTNAEIEAARSKTEAMEAGRMARPNAKAHGEHAEAMLDKLAKKVAKAGGSITRAQWDSAMTKRFGKMDKAAKGYLTPDDLMAMRGHAKAEAAAE